MPYRDSSILLCICRRLLCLLARVSGNGLTNFYVSGHKGIDPQIRPLHFGWNCIGHGGIKMKIPIDTRNSGCLFDFFQFIDLQICPVHFGGNCARDTGRNMKIRIVTRNSGLFIWFSFQFQAFKSSFSAFEDLLRFSTSVLSVAALMTKLALTVGQLCCAFTNCCSAMLNAVRVFVYSLCIGLQFGSLLYTAL